MMSNSYLKDLFICFLVICFILLGIYHLKARHELAIANRAIVEQCLRNDTLRHTVNGLNQTVDIQSQNILDYDNKIETMLRINSTLSLVNTKLKITSSINSDTIRARYVSVATTSVHDSIFIPVNTKFEFKDRWLKIYGTIGKQNVSIDTLSISNTMTINMGEKRHFFSRNEQDVEIINENPYFKTISMKNITLTDKNKWYNSRLFYLGTGIVGGLFLADRLH